MIQNQYLILRNTRLMMGKPLVTEADTIERVNRWFQALFAAYTPNPSMSIALAQFMREQDSNFMAVIVTSETSALTRYTAYLDEISPAPGSNGTAYTLTVTAAHSKVPFQVWYIDEHGANRIDRFVKFTTPEHTNDA